MTNQKLVYINVGWSYRGPAGDKAEGNFGFLKTNETAHESWNFEELDGQLYGYIPRSAEVQIKRLGANATDGSVSDVTVVWISRNPRTKKTTIIGWYTNATIHRSADHFRLKRAPKMEVDYQIEAPSNNGRLLSVDARQFPIPTKKERGNLGQSPVWYGKDDEFNKAVLAYVERGGKTATRQAKSPRQTDPELHRLIEQAAVDHAIAHYKSEAGGSRRVESVERDGVGWDLVAYSDTGEALKIEVKGLSGKDIVVELTPNEYKQMRSVEHRASYIIYVLSEALTANARSSVFRHDALLSKAGKLVWTNDAGQLLKIEELVAARLSIQ
jgi:hypothetical protein